MSGGFAKVFESLWDGTLADKWETWSLFVFMLAHADANGVIDMTPEAMARRSCIPLDRVREALAVLEAPDPHSRTPDEDGRRIVLLDTHRSWGWRVVNHGAYRAQRDPVARREQSREAKRRERAREDLFGSVSHGQPTSAEVSHGQPKQRQKQTQKQEAEANPLSGDEGSESGMGVQGAGPGSGEAQDGLPEWMPTRQWEAWVAWRDGLGKAGRLTEEAVRLAVRTLTKLRADGNDPAAVLEQSVLNGWKGLFPVNGRSSVTGSRRRAGPDGRYREANAGTPGVLNAGGGNG